MARTVKPEEYALKRQEIMDAAQRLVMTRGYEQLTIQDILREIKISSGAFHHYFDSRTALMEAIIQRILKESEKPLLPVIHDPHMPALQKLQGFFDTLDRIRLTQKASVVKLLRVWYSDDNAILRKKVDEAVFEQRAPLIAEIVQQGIREGVFDTPYPDQAGEVVLALVQGMGSTHSRLLLSLIQALENGAARPVSEAHINEVVESIVITHSAYMDALERVLGAAPQSLKRIDTDAVKVWVNALQEEVQN